MQETFLREFLKSAIAKALKAPPRMPMHAMRVSGSEPRPASLAPRVAQIVDELLQQAVAAGMPLSNPHFENHKLGGGNTAEIVAQVTLHASYAFKLDQNTPKLAEEGKAMRAIKADVSLPQAFRDAWPMIYAVREQSPYAYLMEYFPQEDGWVSLEDRLYPRAGAAAPTISAALRWMHRVLDILFLGYAASVRGRQRPSLRADYFDRIADRLAATAAKDPRFASRPLVVNGRLLRPWREYLMAIKRQAGILDLITPEFSTITHGDPNPGNLMLRTTTADVEVKLIDPKEWVTGDYLFDIAKITHFLEGTGPVEKPVGPAVKARIRESATTALDYAYDCPAWTTVLVESCLERVTAFAAAKQDPHWRTRYELGMAANLLGLPLGRLDKGRDDAALVLYGEGLKWLDAFCQRLGNQPPAVLTAAADEVEPPPLRHVRDWVRTRLVGVCENVDRRGFRLLQWEPTRPNPAGKPAELSLEHEARLGAGGEQEARQLLAQLHQAEGRPLGEALLAKDSRFADLVVRRYPRDTGAQSIDHFYDSEGPKAVLIPRMIAFRERIQGKKFMTWTGEGTQRSLNLELPFVALGDSGVVARLEFNWIDDVAATFLEAADAAISPETRCRNPWHIALQHAEVSPAADRLLPRLEHTTYRQKFGFHAPLGNGQGDRECFVLNLDTVVAQDLATGRVGTFCDVDISSVAPIDTAELQALTALAMEFSGRHGLWPSLATKAWRGAQVTGLA